MDFTNELLDKKSIIALKKFWKWYYHFSYAMSWNQFYLNTTVSWKPGHNQKAFNSFEAALPSTETFQLYFINCLWFFFAYFTLLN